MAGGRCRWVPDPRGTLPIICLWVRQPDEAPTGGEPDMTMQQDPCDLTELALVVSDLESACDARDASGISDGVVRLFARLGALPCPATGPDPLRRVAAGTWVLTKCAENLRELDWQMSNRWHEVEGTVRLAQRCVVQMDESLRP
jgi:hypothetical protein